MHTMRQQLHRRLFAAAAAAAVTVAYVQVTSVPTPPGRQTHYTWDSFVSEVRTNLSATITVIRRERAEHEAILTKMRYDLRTLDETLSAENPRRFG